MANTNASFTDGNNSCQCVIYQSNDYAPWSTNIDTFLVLVSQHYHQTRFLIHYFRNKSNYKTNVVLLARKIPLPNFPVPRHSSQLCDMYCGCCTTVVWCTGCTTATAICGHVVEKCWSWGPFTADRIKLLTPFATCPTPFTTCETPLRPRVFCEGRGWATRWVVWTYMVVRR